MRHVIETGTDGATLCFFDPAALPDDFDEQVKSGPIEVFEELTAAGRFWWTSTGGDGGFLFHFYMDEPVPERIAERAQDRYEIRIALPSGQLWACGAEYAAKDPRRGSSATPRHGLAGSPRMGGRCEAAPGSYSGAAWRTEWPDDAEKNAIKAQLGGDFYARERFWGLSFALSYVAAFVMIIATGGLAIKGFRPEVLGWLSGAVVLLIALAYFSRRRLRGFENNPARKELARAFPSIVVQLHRLP